MKDIVVGGYREWKFSAYLMESFSADLACVVIIINYVFPIPLDYLNRIFGKAIEKYPFTAF